ncbi:MAG: hypothetical protein KKA81_15550 [Bacteroidetes bacterium]|nr:hypothetical protein [Bacteroidota bacterium]
MNMHDQTYTDLILRYLDGIMSENEKMQFEQMLESDEALQNAFQEHKRLFEALGEKDLLKIRAEIKDILEDRKLRKGSWIQNLLWNPWSAAALFCLLIFAGYFLYVNVSNDKPGEVPTIASDTVRFTTPDTIQQLFLGDNITEDSLVIPGSESLHETPALALDETNDPAFQIRGEYLELMGVAYRADYFHLTSPADSAIINMNDIIIFSWEPVNEAYVVDILDGQGNMVYSSDSMVNTPYNVKADFPCGAYIIRISEDDGPVFWSIFMVRNSP